MNLDRIEPSHPKHIPLEDFDRRLRLRPGVVLVKTHALPDTRAWESGDAGVYAARLLVDSPVIYAHRDGRDVLVSFYHYMASYAPHIARKPFADFIRAQRSAPDVPSLSLPAYWQNHVLAWSGREPQALAPFTMMTTEFEPTMRAIAAQVGLRLRPRLTQVKLEANPGWAIALRRILLGPLRRPRRSTAIRPRSGTTGNWREVFDAADLDFFEAEAGEAMRLLGYG